MREKNYNLELIRTISFILVVVIHVSNYFCRAYGRISAGEYGFSLVLDTLARVSVPGFFMLSGALLLGRDEPMEKNRKRVLRFLPPLVFWSVIYYIWNIYYMGSSFDLRKIFWVPAEAHLWYLYAMIPIYLALPFFQVMFKGMNQKMEHTLMVLGTAVVLVSYTLSLFNGELYYDVPLFGDRVYAYYFFLGYYLMKHKETIRISSRKLGVIFIVCNALNVVLTAGIAMILGDHPERTLEYGFPLVIVSAAAFFLLMLRLGNGRVQLKERAKRFIDSWCTCSFGIYLIHILFLDNYKKHLEAEAVSAYFAVPALTIGILLVSYICIYAIRKIPGGKIIA